jgi:type IV pilus assembly protein PilB
MNNAPPPSQEPAYKPKIENPEFFKLVEKQGIIDRDFINDLLEEFDHNALDVLATMIQSGIASKQQLCQLWCNSIGIAHVDLEKTIFQEEIVNKIPERIARMYYAIPVYQMGNTITIATATPDSKEIEAILKDVAGEPVSLVFALPQDIEASIEKEYTGNSAVFEFFNKLAASRLLKYHKEITSRTIESAGGAAILNQLHIAVILYAVTKSASEIHISTDHQKASLDFLIPFREKIHFDADKSVYDILLTRLKALAGIPPEDNGRLVHGRIKVPTPSKKIDVKFEIRAGAAGPGAVLKLTSTRPFRKAIKLENLFLGHHILNKLTARLENSKGHILIAGPPRSGKSTLAYAMLGERAKHFKKNMSIEHAIKFLLPGTDQTFVNPEAGVATFDLLEHGLKQKSDTIYIQHIEAPGIPARVSEAVQSGHFVISGIKADNTIDALEKIILLGGGASLTAIVSQQLVARLCDICKSEYPLKAEHVRSLFKTEENARVFAWSPTGCPYCSQTGFSGLIGIHELLLIDSTTKKMIMEKAAPDKILTSIKPENLYTMHYDGIKKVLRGLTTLDEINRLSF